MNVRLFGAPELRRVTPHLRGGGFVGSRFAAGQGLLQAEVFADRGLPAAEVQQPTNIIEGSPQMVVGAVLQAPQIAGRGETPDVDRNTGRVNTSLKFEGR